MRVGEGLHRNAKLGLVVTNLSTHLTHVGDTTHPIVRELLSQGIAPADGRQSRACHRSGSTWPHQPPNRSNTDGRSISCPAIGIQAAYFRRARLRSCESPTPSVHDGSPSSEPHGLAATTRQQASAARTTGLSSPCATSCRPVSSPGFSESNGDPELNRHEPLGRDVEFRYLRAAFPYISDGLFVTMKEDFVSRSRTRTVERDGVISHFDDFGAAGEHAEPVLNLPTAGEGESEKSLASRCVEHVKARSGELAP